MREEEPTTRPRALLTIAIGLLTLVSPLTGVALGQDDAPERREVWFVHTTVDAHVVDNYATVQVIAQIDNRGPDPEFPFEVRVPDDAMITGLTIERDGTVYNATIEQRGAAREQYDQAKQEERSAGLVEKHRGASVYAYRVNVEATESLRAVLTYEQYLSADRGIYTLPLEAPVSSFGQDTGAEIHVQVEHSDGVQALWSEPSAGVSQAAGGYELSYNVGPRGLEDPTQLDVHYALDPTGEPGSVVTTVHDGTGFFAHRFRATPGQAELPLDLVLVLDTSGSMSGEKIDQLKDAARQVVGMLDADDRLHLSFFSSAVRSPWDAMAHVDEHTAQEAMAEIDATFAGGGTRLALGLQDGFAALNATEPQEDGRLKALVVLTDGHAASTEDQLRGLARNANARNATIYGLAFGAGADWGLIHGLAEDGQGVAHRVPAGTGAEVDLARFMGALTTPVLHNLEIAYGPGIEASATAAPILYAGSELLLLGTFPADARWLNATVHAQSSQGPVTHELEHKIARDDKAIDVGRLVAYHRIRTIQDTLDAHGANETLVEQATQLALDHGFVTDHTSLVLDLPEQDIHAGSDADGAGDQADGDHRVSSSVGSPAGDSDVADSTSGVPAGWRSDSRAGSDGADGDDAQEIGDDTEEEPQETPALGVGGVLVAMLAVALVRRRV